MPGNTGRESEEKEKLPGKDKGKSPDKDDKADKEKAVLVQNPKASSVWLAALQESGNGKKITDIQIHAPLTTLKGRDGNFVPVCLSLRGSCFSNCKREKSHRKLTSAEHTDMTALVDAQIANE